MFLINFRLKKQCGRSDLFDGDEEEYDNCIKDLLRGFRKSYNEYLNTYTPKLHPALKKTNFDEGINKRREMETQREIERRREDYEMERIKRAKATIPELL
jgi:hypothetical protein